MNALLSMALFLVPLWAGHDGKGIVRGTVRDSAGTPQAGVRVAAMAVQPAGASNIPEVLASIGMTDESGAYVLEVPPGQYNIVTGPLDRLRYYPDVNNSGRPTIFSISAGSRLQGIDFLVYALIGTVRDAAGTPKSGVPVVAISTSLKRAI